MSRVVITGASRGIGFAIADIFAANGNELLLTSKDDGNLKNAVQQLEDVHNAADIKAHARDLSQKQQAIEFGKLCLQMGAPDILINNAGIFKPGDIGNELDGTLEEQMAINLYAAYNLTRTLLPAMKENNSGHVFNICSIASLKAYPNGGAYSISKYALHGFSTNLREELKPFNIKVTSVFPGAVFTDSWEGFDNSNNRIMEGMDIARMIYAASQLSPSACVEDIILRPQLGDL